MRYIHSIRDLHWELASCTRIIMHARSPLSLHVSQSVFPNCHVGTSCSSLTDRNTVKLPEHGLLLSAVNVLAQGGEPAHCLQLLFVTSRMFEQHTHPPS